MNLESACRYLGFVICITRFGRIFCLEFLSFWVDGIRDRAVEYVSIVPLGATMRYYSFKQRFLEQKNSDISNKLSKIICGYSKG